MAIGYTWNVSTVDTYPTKSGKSDVVYNVHWNLTGTDDSNTYKDFQGNDINYSYSIYGTQVLDTSDLSSFIAFGSLNAAKIQEWVEAAIGSSRVTDMKASLDAQIAEMITPTSVRKTIS